MIHINVPRFLTTNVSGNNFGIFPRNYVFGYSTLRTTGPWRLNFNNFSMFGFSTMKHCKYNDEREYQEIQSEWKHFVLIIFATKSQIAF